MSAPSHSWPTSRVTSLLSGHRRTGVGAVFVVLAVLAGFAHHELLVVEGPLSAGIRGESLTDAFGWITVIGGTEVAIAVAAVVGLVTWRSCRTFAVAYPATLFVGALLNIGLKELIARPRPPVPATGVALASFPSGHTLQATLLLGLLPIATYLLTSRRWVFHATAAFSVVGILAVGASRVYLGAHWPTDVIGGGLVGAGLILAAERVMAHSRAHAVCGCALSTG